MLSRSQKVCWHIVLRKERKGYRNSVLNMRNTWWVAQVEGSKMDTTLTSRISVYLNGAVGLNWSSRKEDSPLDFPFWETWWENELELEDRQQLLPCSQIKRYRVEERSNTDSQNRNCLQMSDFLLLFIPSWEDICFHKCIFAPRILSDSKNKPPFLIPSIEMESRKHLAAFQIICANLDDSCIAFPD